MTGNDETPIWDYPEEPEEKEEVDEFENDDEEYEKELEKSWSKYD